MLELEILLQLSFLSGFVSINSVVKNALKRDRPLAKLTFYTKLRSRKLITG